MKSHSESVDGNNIPILRVLQRVFSDCSSVLEIGNGTGQHAVYFGEAFSHLKWQTTKRHKQDTGLEKIIRPLLRS